MPPKRKAAATATQRIRGEKPALRADVQEPPTKKRKVTKAPAKKRPAKATQPKKTPKAQATRQKAKKHVPDDMLDDPEKLVRKERFVWRPPSRGRAPSPDQSYWPRAEEVRAAFRDARDIWPPVWRRQRIVQNAFAIVPSGAELERAPPRVPQKDSPFVTQLVRTRYRFAPHPVSLPTRWHGAFDLFAVSPDTNSPGDLEGLQRRLEEGDVRNAMRLSLGWDPREKALEIPVHDVPEVGVLCGAPLLVGEAGDLMQGRDVEDMTPLLRQLLKHETNAVGHPLVVTRGRVGRLWFADQPWHNWSATDGYVAKLHFPAGSCILKSIDTTIAGEGGIKLRKIWEHEEANAEGRIRLRELFYGHFEFTVTITNDRQTREIRTITVHHSFWGIRSKESVYVDHPAFLDLPGGGLETILPPPYHCPKTKVAGDETLRPPPGEDPDAQSQTLDPPLDFSGTFCFVSPENTGLPSGGTHGVESVADAVVPHQMWLGWAAREEPRRGHITPLEIPEPDLSALATGYERVHAEIMWNIDNSGLRWTDGTAVLSEGALGIGNPQAVGVGIRGALSLGFDAASDIPSALRGVLNAGVEVTDGHIGPVHFPLSARATYHTVPAKEYLAYPELETRWTHGFEASLRPRPLPYLDRANAGYMHPSGTLKMRRVWAYTCAAGERHDALAGELFEGYWEFTTLDPECGEYVTVNDTFFAVRWPENERREGKRELANQRMPSRTRIERWREEVLPGPYDHRAWQPDASTSEFRCYRSDQDERDWSLDEPPPSVNNFLKWIDTKVGEDGDLDWKHPPEPDNGPKPSRRRVNIMFRWPKVEESDPGGKFQT